MNMAFFCYHPAVSNSLNSKSMQYLRSIFISYYQDFHHIFSHRKWIYSWAPQVSWKLKKPDLKKKLESYILLFVSFNKMDA